MCTGLGMAELVNIPLLIVCRYLLMWEWLYQILQYVYFLVYLLEDLIPFGPFGYHLMLVATRNNDELLEQASAMYQAETAAHCDLSPWGIARDLVRTTSLLDRTNRELRRKFRQACCFSSRPLHSSQTFHCQAYVNSRPIPVVAT